MTRPNSSRNLFAVAAAGVGLALPMGAVFTTAAGADTVSCPAYPGNECTSTTQPVTGTGGGTPAPSTAAAGNTLAFTGADIAEMAAVGAGAAGLGMVLVWRSRRRRAPASA